MKFLVVSLFALVTASTAEEDPSLRGTLRDLRDWQIGDFASARPQSVAGNYYANGTTNGGTTGTAGAVPFAEIGNNGVPANVFPLGECQGDCDTDAECQSGLVCFQRTADEAVPGCTGTARTGIDFCYNPNAAATQTGIGPSIGIPGSGGGYRLKLYWELGYYWQEEVIERKWCMVCHTTALGGSGCLENDDLHLETCDPTNTLFDFVTAPNNAVQVQVFGSELCLELSNTGAYQAITLQICDSTNPSQGFTAGQGGFTSYRFELVATDGGCLSNTHHPKQGEYIYDQDCAKPRASTTSYWNTY
jgi:hypothetical protein